MRIEEALGSRAVCPRGPRARPRLGARLRSASDTALHPTPPRPSTPQTPCLAPQVPPELLEGKVQWQPYLNWWRNSLDEMEWAWPTPMNVSLSKNSTEQSLKLVGASLPISACAFPSIGSLRCLSLTLFSKRLNKESSGDDGGNVRCAVRSFAARINELSEGEGGGRITSMWFSCDLPLVIVMGESGLGPIIEADNNQQEGGSTNISEIHHHPVTKSNKNGSSPGYLKVNVIYIDAIAMWFLRSLSQIEEWAHQIHSLSVKVNFGVNRCKWCQPKTFSQPDQFQFYTPLSSSMVVEC